MNNHSEGLPMEDNYRQTPLKRAKRSERMSFLLQHPMMTTDNLM